VARSASLLDSGTGGGDPAFATESGSAKRSAAPVASLPPPSR